MTTPPLRIRWAVDQLRPRRGARVLELGMGRGVAAALLLEPAEPAGPAEISYVGVDRSAVAVRAARERLEPALRRGDARVIESSAARLDVADVGPVDVAFAVNVNAFWTGPADRELDVLRRLLAPRGGRLHLFYEAPGTGQAHRIRDLAVQHLQHAGFSPAVSVGPHPEPPRLLQVTATLPAVPENVLAADGRTEPRRSS